jgi:hypothetical protein
MRNGLSLLGSQPFYMTVIFVWAAELFPPKFAQSLLEMSCQQIKLLVALSQ